MHVCMYSYVYVFVCIYVYLYLCIFIQSLAQQHAVLAGPPSRLPVTVHCLTASPRTQGRLKSCTTSRSSALQVNIALRHLRAMRVPIALLAGFTEIFQTW